MIRLWFAWLFLAVTLTAAAPGAMAQTAKDVTVFAAASLTNALQDLAAAFEATTGVRVKVSFAASSALAKQIEAGAGPDVFVSADESWMDYLQQRGFLANSTRKPLLGNRLVVVVPADRRLTLVIAQGSGWLEALPQGRIATGDPSHVPVGKYAEQSLRALGAWAAVAPRLAKADNVRSALVLVERGEAAAGIVYATDAAVAKGVAVAGVFPDSLHDPIVYPIALLAGRDQGGARAFYDYLISEAAHAVFIKHGFAIR
jgi:molybdate transport system substrate-binding protein